MKKIVNKIKNNKKLIGCLFAFALLLICFAIPILLTQYNSIKVPSQTINYKAQTSNKNVTDKVKLIDNEQFQNDSDGYYSYDFYVKDLVKNVYVDYNNTLNFNSNDVDVNIFKTVFVKLILECSAGPVWENSLVYNNATVEPDDTKFVSTDSYLYQIHSINNNTTADLGQTIELDYQPFKDKFTQVQTQLPGITVTDAKILVSYVVKVNGSVNNKSFVYSDTILSEIPITATAGTIDFTHTISPAETIEKQEITYLNKVNNFLVLLGFIFIGVSISIVFFLIYVIVEKKRETAKQRYINKILNEYNDIIVYNTEKIFIQNHKTIVVKSFEDMVKAEVEMSTPINLFNTDNIFEFYIFGKGFTYYYRFDATDEKDQQ